MLPTHVSNIFILFFVTIGWFFSSSLSPTQTNSSFEEWSTKVSQLQQYMSTRILVLTPYTVTVYPKPSVALQLVLQMLQNTIENKSVTDPWENIGDEQKESMLQMQVVSSWDNLHSCFDAFSSLGMMNLVFKFISVSETNNLVNYSPPLPHTNQ
jgi:hypothetical protein